MFYTDAYIKDEGKVDTVKIITLKGTDAKAEYKGEELGDATSVEENKICGYGGIGRRGSFRFCL